MRFLLEWHGFGEGVGELEQVLSQLEGWAAPVAAWEQGLLSARCAEYSPQQLDELFLSGLVSWFRPGGAGPGAQQLVAATPIAIVARDRAGFWRDGGVARPERLGGVAARIFDILREGGATFTGDLARHTNLLEPQLEQGLAELVAQGLVSADAFSPLRWLIRPESEKRRKQRQAGRRRLGVRGGLLGRWSLAQTRSGSRAAPPDAELFPDQARLAAVCEALLLRYGVVFRAVLERESLAPPWRHLLRYLRRMEDRGEVHGGRFVDGFSGEQFALPEAVGLLRRHESAPGGPRRVVISAADPLNLGGIVTPGAKTPARPGNRILLSGGLPVARIQGDELELMQRDADVTLADAERHLRTVHRLFGSDRVGSL
jgi:ATP-dependent Lhr-like helicase